MYSTEVDTHHIVRRRNSHPGNRYVSHLRAKKSRPASQRAGHVRVVRTQHLLDHFRGSHEQRLSLLKPSLDATKHARDVKGSPV